MNAKTQLPKSKLGQAFSRIELLLVLAIAMLLAAVQLSSLAGSRQPVQLAGCQNNLRQLGTALLMYSAENDHYFPGRYFRPSWAEKLRPYYKDLKLLKCPSELGNPAYSSPYPGDQAPRSYIYNGWNDYFYDRFGDTYFQTFNSRTNPFPESAIALPAETITLGEKFSQSFHLYMDLLMGDIGNDFTECDQTHHFHDSQNLNSGGSNHSFADGSVRYLPYSEGFQPVILWATVESFREAYFIP